jgi:hypothetical protein
MSAQRLKLLAIILIVLGAALIIWSFNLSDSAANEILRVFNGSSMDEVVYRFIAGAVSLAAGLFLFLKEK